METAYPWASDPPGVHSNPECKSADAGLSSHAQRVRKSSWWTLTHTVLAAGGDGVNYWAPDLIANHCATRNSGSTTALIDFDGKVLPGIDFMQAR